MRARHNTILALNRPACTSSPIPQSINKWRTPASIWYIQATPNTHKANFKYALVNNAVNCIKESTEDKERLKKYSMRGSKIKSTNPEIRCKIDAIAMGGYFKLVKSRFTGLLWFTIDTFLLESVLPTPKCRSISLCYFLAKFDHRKGNNRCSQCNRMVINLNI